MKLDQNRPLTGHEHSLARWMLENGTAEAKEYLGQLELAEVTPWKCQCGCASINFQLKGHPEAVPGVHILGDYLMGSGESLSGAFIFSSENVLSGIELYALTGDASPVLPWPQELRPNAMKKP
jgi:hypothetical protein